MNNENPEESSLSAGFFVIYTLRAYVHIGRSPNGAEYVFSGCLNKCNFGCDFFAGSDFLFMLKCYIIETENIIVQQRLNCSE